MKNSLLGMGVGGYERDAHFVGEGLKVPIYSRPEPDGAPPLLYKLLRIDLYLLDDITGHRKKCIVFHITTKVQQLVLFSVATFNHCENVN